MAVNTVNEPINGSNIYWIIIQLYDCVIDLWVAVTQNFEDKVDFESIQMFMIGCHFSS